MLFKYHFPPSNNLSLPSFTYLLQITLPPRDKHISPFYILPLIFPLFLSLSLSYHSPHQNLTPRLRTRSKKDLRSIRDGFGRSSLSLCVLIGERRVAASCLSDCLRPHPSTSRDAAAAAAAAPDLGSHSRQCYEVD